MSVRMRSPPLFGVSTVAAARLQLCGCAVEKSASRPIETRAPFVGGYQGDRIEQCHISAIKSKRRLPAYSTQIATSLLWSCAGASSGCLNLTVPLAATFGLKMLKRPILHFSARRHRAPEAIFRSRSMKFAGRLRLQRGRFESQWCVFTGIPSSRGEGEPRLSQFLRFK